MYLFNREYHTDTSEEYMTSLGIDAETRESILRQQEFEKLHSFKQSRQQQLDTAVVTISTGKKFDADEASISRMLGRLYREQNSADDTLVGWSLYTDPTGVKTQITLAELKEAYQLAVDNMDALWGVTDETN